MNQPNGEPRASYRAAYVLCILLGWIGAHRYYLRRWGTAVLYTVTSGVLIGLLVRLVVEYSRGLEILYLLIGGLLVTALLVDLLTLPLLVRQRRDIEAGIPLPPDAAPWAKDEQDNWWNRFQLLLRFAILVVLPAATIVIALSLGQKVVVVLVLVLLAFSLLLGSIGRGLYALEEMKAITQRVPFVSAAIDVVSRFQGHYSQYRTGSVLFYLLYPALGPLLMLFSPAARSEFRPFRSLFSLVVFGVLVENTLSYFRVFPISYLDLQFGVYTCIVMALGGIALFFVCVVPIVSSSFYLSMTGRSFSLRASAALALFACGFAIYAARSATSVSFRGALTVTEKLNNEDFRNRFDAMNKMFLRQGIDRLAEDFSQNKQEYDWEQHVSVWQDPVISGWSSSAKIWSSSTSTAWYHTFMSGILRSEEAAAFRIVAILPDDRTARVVPWLAVQFIPDPVGIGGLMGESVLLYVASPDNSISRVGDAPYVYDHWGELPGWFQEQFLPIIPRTHLRESPNQLTKELLFGDLMFDGQQKRIPGYGVWKNVD